MQWRPVCTPRMITPAAAVGVSIGGLFVVLVVSVGVAFCIYLYKHPTTQMTRVREIKKDTSNIKQKAESRRRELQATKGWACCVRAHDVDGQTDPENNQTTDGPDARAVPDNPDDVTLEDPTGHEVTITWSISNKDNVQRFQIFKRFGIKGSSWTKVKTIKKPKVLCCRIKGLDSDVRYVFGVTAKNVMGKSAMAESVSIVLKQKPVLPGAPSELTTWQKSGTTLTLSWKPPKFDGHVRINRYHITMRDQNMEWEHVTSVQAFDRFMDYRVTDLVQNVAYRFRVCAENDVGVGAYAETRDVFLNNGPMPPDQPRGPLRYADITHNSVVVFWQEPEHDGRQPISGYAVEVLEAKKAKWRKVGVVPKRKTSFWISKLSEGCEYFARVVAINNVGNSQPLMGTKFKTKFLEIPLHQRSVSRMYNLSRRPSRGSSGTSRSLDTDLPPTTIRAAVKRSRSGKQRNGIETGRIDQGSRDSPARRDDDINYENESGFSEFGDSEARSHNNDMYSTNGINGYLHNGHQGGARDRIDVGVETAGAGYRSTVEAGTVTEPGRANTTDTDGGVSTEASNVSNHAKFSYLRNTVHRNVVPSNISYGFR